MMRQLTQTNLDPGNCWQTCIACILDLDPEVLPPQVDYDKRERDGDGWKWVGPSYMGVLQRYLRKHHGLAYVELHQPPELWSILSVKPGVLHMLTGRTIRTATNGSRHVVVASAGKMVWDPHPSRAGLTDEIQPSFLVPLATWDRTMVDCVCPACGGAT